MKKREIEGKKKERENNTNRQREKQERETGRDRQTVRGKEMFIQKERTR